MTKECALSTGKLPPGGLPGNSVVKKLVAKRFNGYKEFDGNIIGHMICINLRAYFFYIRLFAAETLQVECQQTRVWLIEV